MTATKRSRRPPDLRPDGSALAYVSDAVGRRDLGTEPLDRNAQSCDLASSSPPMGRPSPIQAGGRRRRSQPPRQRPRSPLPPRVHPGGVEQQERVTSLRFPSGGSQAHASSQPGPRLTTRFTFAAAASAPPALGLWEATRPRVRGAPVPDPTHSAVPRRIVRRAGRGASEHAAAPCSGAAPVRRPTTNVPSSTRARRT